MTPHSHNTQTFFHVDDIGNPFRRRCYANPVDGATHKLCRLDQGSVVASRAGEPSASMTRSHRM